ncbi:LysR family transcriptional regulator [Microbacterium halophytorum]|uniref:LysR family transcriptional regulator n=1 Tax=Microbacterium halophytorum TaxID=2067568 RepID=UPI000CFB0E58|nr:LysR family transcriptional regulator [Microbacterium halophytorum]
MATGWSTHRLQLLRELQLRGTITAVATALSYAPSTVSQQLGQLEREVGAALLEAEGRRVRLTAAGVIVAEHAAAVLALEERARARLDAGAVVGRARVAVLPTVAHAMLARTLDALAEAHPGIRVDVVVLPPEEGLFEVEARGFDLAIAEQYPGFTRELRPGLDRVVLGSDPIRLAVAPGSPVRSLADARDQPWVMEPAGTAVRAWTVERCREAGFEPDIRFTTEDLVAQARLISSGHAVGLLPDQLRAGEDAPMRAIALPGAPVREIFTAAREAAVDAPVIVAVREALRAAFDAG